MVKNSKIEDETV